MKTANHPHGALGKATSRHGTAQNQCEAREQIREQILEWLDTAMLAFMSPRMKTECRAAARDLRRELDQLGTVKPAKLTAGQRQLANAIHALLKAVIDGENQPVIKAARKLRQDRRFLAIVPDVPL